MRFRPQAGKSDEEGEEEGGGFFSKQSYDYCERGFTQFYWFLNTTANIQTWVQYQFKRKNKGTFMIYDKTSYVCETMIKNLF